MLQLLLAEYINILMIYESKCDGTFLIRNPKFLTLDRTPNRLDRNNRRGEILSFVRKKLITRLLLRHSFPMILQYY